MAWPCPTLVLVGRLKSKLNPFGPAVVVLVFGRPKVNIEDVVGSSDGFPEVRVKSAPANVLASEVCVDVSPLDEETWLAASWLSMLFELDLLTGECKTMFAAERALLALRVVREGRLGSCLNEPWSAFSSRLLIYESVQRQLEVD